MLALLQILTTLAPLVEEAVTLLTQAIHPDQVNAFVSDLEGIAAKLKAAIDAHKAKVAPVAA